MKKQENLVKFTLVVVYLSLASFNLFWLFIFPSISPRFDFEIYRDALQTVANGGNPYLPYQIGLSFVYHPIALSFLSLFGFVWSESIAFYLWTTISFIMYWLTIKWIFKIVDELGASHPELETLSREDKIVLTIFLLSFVPFIENLFIGQINIFILYAICRSFYAHLKEQGWQAGAWLGAAMIIKVTPGLLLIYYFAKKGWREIAGAGLAGIGLSVLSAIQFGADIMVDYIKILPILSAEIHPSAFNQSILSIAFLALGNTEAGPVLITIHKIVFGIILALLLLISAWQYWQKPQTLIWNFCISLVITVAISPLIWMHHNLFLILPIVIMFAAGSTGRKWAFTVFYFFQIARLVQIFTIQVTLLAVAAQVAIFIFMATRINADIKQTWLSPVG